MEEFNTDAPYYHSNYKENISEIYRVLLQLLQQYGHNVEDSMITDETVIPQTYRIVEWEDKSLNRIYAIEQNLNIAVEHAIFYITDIYDNNEEETRAYAYQIGLVCDEKEVVQERTQLSRTKQNQAKWDSWVQEQTTISKSKGRNFIFLPDTMTDLVQETEMILHILDHAEKAIAQ